MKHTVNGKECTTDELICFVIASAVEDVYNHFDEYAEQVIHDWNEMNDGDMEAIEKWKPRVFSKINTRLGKKKMVGKEHE